MITRTEQKTHERRSGKLQRKQIILARAGTFGSEDNPQTVTEDDLREIAGSYKDGDAVPVTVAIEGHPGGGNFPKLGGGRKPIL